METAASVATDTFFDYARWADRLPELKQEYRAHGPYPHIVIEDFLPVETAHKIKDAFPGVKDEGWIHYIHFNERKHGLNKQELLPSYIRAAIAEFNSPEFVAWVSELTGIPGLMADDMLEGGGLHQSLRGGFLNVHADFTVHPHKPKWQRRVNLLVYFNEDWKPEYNGDLELWDQQMKACQARIAPLFNRAVLFNTDHDSFHGVPDVIQCPETETRKSIALYYFTEEAAPKKNATNYQARPGDGAVKTFLSWADKQALVLYNWLKGKLGIDDKFISKVLTFFGGKR